MYKTPVDRFVNINGARCQVALFSNETLICPQKNWKKCIDTNPNPVPRSDSQLPGVDRRAGIFKASHSSIVEFANELIFKTDILNCDGLTSA